MGGRGGVKSYLAPLFIPSIIIFSRKYDKETPLPTPTYKKNQWNSRNQGKNKVGWSSLHSS